MAKALRIISFIIALGFIASAIYVPWRSKAISTNYDFIWSPPRSQSLDMYRMHIEWVGLAFAWVALCAIFWPREKHRGSNHE